MSSESESSKEVLQESSAACAATDREAVATRRVLQSSVVHAQAPPDIDPPDSSDQACACGKQLQPAEKFCSSCGTKKTEACACGRQFQPWEKFCSSCGTKKAADHTVAAPQLTHAVPPQDDKNAHGFAIGAEVAAHGLKTAALNGVPERVLAARGDRVSVKFPEPIGEKALKPANLKVAPIVAPIALPTCAAAPSVVAVRVHEEPADSRYIPLSVPSRSKVLVHIDESQFHFEGGQSACTAVCCEFGVGFLEAASSGVTSDFFKEYMEVSLPFIIEAGIGLARQIDNHRSSSGDAEHESVSEVFNAPPARGLRDRIDLGTPGNIASVSHAAFLEVVTRELRHDSGIPAALALTKPPETVLCLCAPGMERPYMLFDSHSRRGGGASLLAFSTAQLLADELHTRFPYTQLSDDVDPLHRMMINACEFTRICPHGTTDAGSVNSFASGALQPPTVPMREPPPSASTRMQEQPSASPQPSVSRPTSGGQLSHDERNTLCCPISQELMADPVQTADGRTYERSQIDQYWSSQREAEAARIQASGEEQPAADNCCGRARAPIVETSPMTNLPMRNIDLHPNLSLLSFIQSAVDSRRVPASDAEDWRVRRQEVERANRERDAAQPPQEVAGPEPAQVNVVHPEPPYERLAGTLVVRSARVPQWPRNWDRGMLFRPRHWGLGMFFKPVATGLAIDLCTLDECMPAHEADGRCSIPACAARLNRNCVLPHLTRPRINNCRRCGRVACARCISHEAVDLQSGESMAICGECVEDIIDRLPANPQGTRMRFLLRNRMERWTQLLEEDAALHEREHRQAHLAQFPMTIDTPQRSIVDEPPMIQERVLASIAHDAVDVTQLQIQYDNLLRQHNVADMSEEQQIQHMMQLSESLEALEIAQVAHAEQMSSGGALAQEQREQHMEHDDLNLTGLTEATARLGRLQSLEAQYAQLAEALFSQMGEEEQLQMTLELTRVMQELDTVQLEMVNAATSTHAPANRSEVRRPVPAPGLSSAAGEQRQQGSQGRQQPQDPPRVEVVDNVRALETQYEQLTLALDTATEEEQVGWIEELTRVMVDLDHVQLEEMATRASVGEAPPLPPAVEVAPPLPSDENVMTEGLQQEMADGEQQVLRAGEWPLPLGLQYPTPRMRRREARVEAARQNARREVDREHLTQQREQQRRRRVQEEHQHQQQVQQHQETQRRAQQLQHQTQMELESAEAARLEEQRRVQRQQEEREEERTFQQAMQSLGPITGGVPKMCNRCGYGPIINQACNDMGAHNNDGGRNLNHCPRCNWFDADWNRWPEWDGGVRSRGYQRS